MLKRDIEQLEKNIGYNGILHFWKRPADYMGESYYGHLIVPVGLHRDSEAIERSNFEVALEMLGGESDAVMVVRASHWAVGWAESLYIDPLASGASEAIEIAENIARSLEDYPLLDEDHYSQLQWDDATGYWLSMSLAERVELCVKYDINIFAARHDYIPRDDNGGLFDYLTAV